MDKWVWGFRLKETDTHPNDGHVWVNNLQAELMVDIYSKSLVRAIGKVSLMNLSQNTN